MKRRSRKISKQFKKLTPLYSSARFKIALLISALLLTIINVMITPSPGTDNTIKSTPSDSLLVPIVVSDILSQYNIPAKWQKKKSDQLEIHIPQNFQFHNLYMTLQKRLKKIDSYITKCDVNLKNQNIEMIIGNKHYAYKLIFVRKASLSAIAGKAAIIIDDFGYNYNKITRKFISYSRPLTLSIIPGLAETQRIHRNAILAHKEIMIHMPMEPIKEKYKDNGFILLTSMNASEIRVRLLHAFSQLPNTLGLNNHQGSKATTDPRLMQTVMNEIKKTDKYFIDSRTSSKSIALQVARNLGLPCAANQVFLDADNDRNFIIKQFNRLGELAGKKGQAIGIGHVRPLTFEILEIMIPQLESRGIEFVFISDIINH